MKKLAVFCFAASLTLGAAFAQDHKMDDGKKMDKMTDAKDAKSKKKKPAKKDGKMDKMDHKMDKM